MASSSSSSSPFLFVFLSLVCFFFFIEDKPFVSAITRKEYSELQPTDHHHVPLSSLFPSSSCSSSPQGRSREGSLEIIHKHGPCSKLKQHTTSSPSSSSVKAPLIIPHSEILERDKARVRAIKSKLQWEEQRQAREQDGRPMTSQASDQVAAEASLPARSGEIIGSGDYFVKVGLGTPARELSLIFDTGSDLTWTQCLPCDASDSCYTQNEPIFNPSQSSSYSDIPCSSSQCSQLSPHAGIEKKCSASASTGSCLYGITYADNSFSDGNFAKETLTITSFQAVVNDFLFGCGHDNVGHFNGTAGLIGLGRSPVSFVQQTSDIFHKIFSYCIPSTESEAGYLNFGGVPASDDIIFTPFSSILKSSSFYALDVTGISVAGASLSIPSSAFSSGVIIDSGTTITWLPSTVYVALRDVFQEAMSRYPKGAPIGIFDTCYDLSGHDTVVVPKVTLSFGGGVNVELDVNGVLYAVTETQVCLAFAANEDDGNVAIIGNIQQKALEVVYDVDGAKIGFRPCMSGNSKVTKSQSSAILNHPNFIWMVGIYFITYYFFFKF